jgi:autotransporter-associated beta strand protein
VTDGGDGKAAIGLGGNGGVGALTIQNGATVNIDYTLQAGSGAGTGFLNVVSGAHLHCPAGVLYDDLANVKGSASWTMSTLDIGSNSLSFPSSGALSVTTGASVTVSGVTTVWNHQSSINIGGGTLTTGLLASSSNAGGISMSANPVGGSAQLVITDDTAADSATFAGAISGTGQLIKNGASTEVLTGSNSVTGTTSINGGVLTVTSAGSLLSSTITVGATTTFNASGALSTTAAITDNGTLNLAGNNSASATLTRKLSSLAIGDGALATVALSASTVFPEILNPTTLSFAGSGKLDLTNNELKTKATVAAIQADLAADAIFTTHTGTGTALGYADVGSGITEVRYTLQGDTNLDGKVDVGDLGALATNFGQTGGAVWAQGDFDSNGTVDVGDLGALSTNYGSSLAAGSLNGSAAAPLDTLANVPEPASISVVCSTCALLARRRSGRRRLQK